MEKDKGYHNLIIWQKTKTLVITIYRSTEILPRSEDIGLKSQIRRAIVSVVLNLVEGHRRKSKKEFLRFLEMADSSLVEVEACWELIFALNFINEETFQKVEKQRQEVALILHAFTRSIAKR